MREHQRHRALRVGRGKQHAHRAALGDSDQRGTTHADRVHDGAHIVHAFFQRRKVLHRHRIGHAGSAFVEQDQARKRRQPREVAAQLRVVPDILQVRDKARHQHHVQRPLPDHLVRDVVAPALRIKRLRLSQHGVAPREFPASREIRGVVRQCTLPQRHRLIAT